MVPRIVQVEHPEPWALVIAHCPPCSEETKLVWLPSESVICAWKATVNIGPWLVMFPTVTMTGPVVAPSGTVATICVSLQVLIAAVAPLKLAVLTGLLPCVAPNPDPLIVTVAPGAPVVGDTPVVCGFASDPPGVTETLSNVAVVRVDGFSLLTPNPTYTVCAVVIVCVVPIWTQVEPSPQA